MLKVLLAGADVAMMTSALLRNGPDHLRPLETQVRDWMDRHGFETLASHSGHGATRRIRLRGSIRAEDERSIGG